MPVFNLILGVFFALSSITNVQAQPDPLELMASGGRNGTARGGGGHPEEIAFQKEGHVISRLLKKSPVYQKSSGVSHGAFEKIVKTAKLEAYNGILCLRNDGKRTIRIPAKEMDKRECPKNYAEKPAINYPDKKEIVFSLPYWKSIKDYRIKKRRLVYHEYLSLLGFEFNVAPLASTLFENSLLIPIPEDMGISFDQYEAIAGDWNSLDFGSRTREAIRIADEADRLAQHLKTRPKDYEARLKIFEDLVWANYLLAEAALGILHTEPNKLTQIDFNLLYNGLTTGLKAAGTLFHHGIPPLEEGSEERETRLKIMVRMAQIMFLSQLTDYIVSEVGVIRDFVQNNKDQKIEKKLKKVRRFKQASGMLFTRVLDGIDKLLAKSKTPIGIGSQTLKQHTSFLRECSLPR